MKNRLLLLFSLCATGLGIWEAQAENPESTSKDFMEINIPFGYDEIELHGELMLNIGPNAIVAGASDDAVYIGFNEDFGSVNISIYNGLGGLVYSTVVNSSIQTEVFIPFANVSIGTYLVELNNANGYAEGDFEHN